MPGIHRTQRVPADELQGVLLNLVLWRTEHDHRAGEVAVQQGEQALLITAARARGPHQRARDLEPCPRPGDGRNVWIS
jgi:hypothetical protein